MAVEGGITMEKEKYMDSSLTPRERAEDLLAKLSLEEKMVMENSPHHIPAIFHMEGLCGAFIKDRFRLQSVSLNCVA